MGGEKVRETLEEYCRRTERPELLEEWDVVQNLPLTPAQVSRGSRR